MYITMHGLKNVVSAQMHYSELDYKPIFRECDEMFILIMKANEMHYFSNLFDKALYIFRTCPLSIIRRYS
jgi:hypothetical protein